MLKVGSRTISLGGLKAAVAVAEHHADDAGAGPVEAETVHCRDIEVAVVVEVADGDRFRAVAGRGINRRTKRAVRLPSSR